MGCSAIFLPTALRKWRGHGAGGVLARRQLLHTNPSARWDELRGGGGLSQRGAGGGASQWHAGTSRIFLSQSGAGSRLTAECQLKTVVSDRDARCLRVKSDLMNTFGVHVEVSTYLSFLSVWWRFYCQEWPLCRYVLVLQFVFYMLCPKDESKLFFILHYYFEFSFIFFVFLFPPTGLWGNSQPGEIRTLRWRTCFFYSMSSLTVFFLFLLDCLWLTVTVRWWLVLSTAYCKLL